MNDFSSEIPKSPEQKKKPLRIIYIEDQKDFRELIKGELEKFPADVELVASFDSTEEAKEYLMGIRNEKKELPDGIVSDHDLGIGKVTGMQFAKDLKEQGFEIPVVLFTGYAEQFKSFSEEDFKAMGLTKVVNKRESIEGLVGVLKNIEFLTS